MIHFVTNLLLFYVLVIQTTIFLVNKKIRPKTEILMQLSGGQQQRVAIARSIVNQPILLLADELTGALDSRTSQEVMEIFQRLNDGGMTIVMVSHDSEIARLCQRIIWFQDGKIVDPQQLTTAELEQYS